MANGYLHGKYEQNGATDYAPKPGNESVTPSYSSKLMYFPITQAKPTLGADPAERDDELRNTDQPALRITDTYDPTWEYQSRLYPDLGGWHLGQMFGRVANYTVAAGTSATDLDGTTALATGQYSHTWAAPFGPTGAIPQTSRMVYAYKDQSTFYEARGCATEQLEIDTPDKGGVEIKASGPALYLNTLADPSLTPSYETLAIRPFVHGNLAITYPTLSGSTLKDNTGTTSGFSVSVRNPIAAVRTLGINSLFPDRMERDEGLITITGTITKRNLTAADWEAMRNLDTFSITAKWVSNSYITGSSGAKYGLSLTIPAAQMVSGDIDDLDNKRRHGASFNWIATYNGTDPSATWKLVNATSTYAQ